MPQQLIIDPRLPTPQLSDSDPAYPRNLIRSITMIRNQAVADTKYDITPPPRIEAFSHNSYENNPILHFLAIMVVLVTIAYAVRPLPLWKRIGAAMIAITAIRFILKKFSAVH